MEEQTKISIEVFVRVPRQQVGYAWKSVPHLVRVIPKSIKNDAQINQKTIPGRPWASQGHLKETEIVYNVHL